jgi:uncharacterized protein
MTMKFDFEKAKGKQVRTAMCELRDTGDEFALVGVAALHNSLSKNLGGFRETILPGAFSNSVKNQNSGEGVVCLFNHQSDRGVLGRTTAGTLKVWEDSVGLHYRCQLDKNQQSHKDLYSSVQRGDVRYNSFAFTVEPGGQQWAPGKDPEDGSDCAMRTLTSVDLIDVSPVNAPAYSGTALSAREMRSADYIPVDIAYQVKQLRKAAELMESAVAEIRKSPYPAPYSYDGLDKWANRALELASAAFACSDLIGDTLDDWDDDDTDRAHAAFHRALRAAHTDSHAAVDAACDKLARTHMALARCIGKK